MAKFLPYSEETAAQSIRMAIADSLSQMSVAMTNGWIEIQSPSDWRAYSLQLFGPFLCLKFVLPRAEGIFAHTYVIVCCTILLYLIASSCTIYLYPFDILTGYGSSHEKPQTRSTSLIRISNGTGPFLTSADCPRNGTILFFSRSYRNKFLRASWHT